MRNPRGAAGFLACLAVGALFVGLLSWLAPVGPGTRDDLTGYDGPLPEIVIRVVVTDIRFPEPGDVVDVLGSPDYRYIVRLKKKVVLKGLLSESWLTALIHSPSQELPSTEIGDEFLVGFSPVGSNRVSLVQAPGHSLPDVSKVKYRLSRLHLPPPRIDQAAVRGEIGPSYVDSYRKRK